MIGLLKAVGLSLLPGLAWAQGRLSCQPETQARTVANTNDTATLARVLQCSNGSFFVEWVGHVVVSETINVSQGTSLTISGASTGATADGNHTSQLFVVDGASSLHLTDMVLSNGDAGFGGAILALHQSSVSFGGNMTFASNTGLYGGAIFSGPTTTVFWDGEETTFRNNYASKAGGAISAGGLSDISWDGVTAFVKNSAGSAGGAVCLNQSSKLSWSSKTTFVENTALVGGAICAQSSTVVWDGSKTTFSNNHALDQGGALIAARSSSVSWDSDTVFRNNSAGSGGGAAFVTESSITVWSSKTTFMDNTAGFGGAIYAYSSSVAWFGEVTVFSNNHALTYGGGVMAANSSSVSWNSETIFSNNSAGIAGGAILAHEASSISWSGKTTFTENTASSGGAILADFSSVIWDGNETTFISNYAYADGGAFRAQYLSSVAWGGETVFDNNTAARSGGAVCVTDYSNVSWEGETVFVGNKATAFGGGACIGYYSNFFWTGNTTFRNNSADVGGGSWIFEDSVGAWSGTTNFASNTATRFGGGLHVAVATLSWTGTTIFTSNMAEEGGAIFLVNSNISWAGNTTFADNVAHSDGGAMYASATSGILCRGRTIFRNNSASTGNGGAIGIYGYTSNYGPNVNISGETTFLKNSAAASGGAIFSSANPRGQYYEGVVFLYNSANIGGAVATFGTGNDNELGEFPTKFLRCQFISNTAIETGGAVETAFGREEFVSTSFDSNYADIGGALNLGGATTVLKCSFISNSASSSGLAVDAVGALEVFGSSFYRNSFFCHKGDFLEESLQDSSSTARYESVCRGCPPWNDCQSCTVSDINYDPVCSIALEHTTSAEPGTTLETLSVDSGYWRATKESSNILACYNSGSCLGGQTGEDFFCDDGYMGPYCAVCQRGYSSSLSTTCTRCSTSRSRWFVAIAVTTGIVAVCAMAAVSGYLMSTNFEERESTSMYHKMIRKAPLQAVKSVIVVWQILTQFASVANVTYPGVYQTVLSSLDIINLDIGSVVSAGCLWSSFDFHDRLIADTIWPLAVLGILGITYAIALRRNFGSDYSVREKVRNKHLSAVLFLMFLVFSSVSSTVFRMFACDSLDDGGEYLRADYRILCTDAKHRALQVYAAIMIVVYPVGIPLLFAVLLYRHRVVLSDYGADRATAQSISSLWAPYRPSCFFYEVVECGRRIMLTGVVVFIYPNDTAQIAITILNSFFFFAVSEALSPYKAVSNTWLSRFGHVLVFFTMFDILLLKVDASQESSESQRILGAVFVAGHVVMILAVLAEAIALCYASRQATDHVVEEPNPFRSALRVASKSVNSSRP